MGFTQWALASTRPPHLQAMVVALSTSVRKFSWYPGDSYALEVIIPWDLGAVNFNKHSAGNIVDDVTKECLGAIPDTSISGRRVARELTTIVARRGRPDSTC